ncbi:hypothetical protein OAG71_01575 [bacterium]|nr:hypothetical protein [bacterium]
MIFSVCWTARHSIAASTLFAVFLCGCETPHDESAIKNDVADPPAAVVVEQSQEAPVVAEPSIKAIEARFLCWNLESEGSDPNVIAQQIKELGPYDIYAFTEFLPSAEELFAGTLGEDYKLIMSKSGYRDRLAIAFDVRKFDLVKFYEIKEINFQNRYRSPLVLQLKDKKSGIEFYVMNNHLARGKEKVRETQADQLVEWGRKQLLPVIALGDYNLDYVFATDKGNTAFPKMMKDNVWKWIKPVELIDTNWYDNPQEPDGEDDYPGSLLDFAFVLGPAKEWNASCKVIVRPGDFPDNETTSDHRPFELTIAK